MNSELQSHQLGFNVVSTDIRQSILLPRFYDPSLDSAIHETSDIAEFTTLRTLRDDGHLVLASGSEVGSMAYGTGLIPFIRTSDLSNWEIKSNPKQAIARHYAEQVSKNKSVAEKDILFARDGTYLIGTASLVSKYDIPAIHQSHVVRFRVADNSPVPAGYLLAALRSPIVQRQLRARQFTADIIDTLGDRYLDVKIPVLNDSGSITEIDTIVMHASEQRAKLRMELGNLPLEVSKHHVSSGPFAHDEQQSLSHGFSVPRSAISSSILLAKYYDPSILELKSVMERDCTFTPITDLAQRTSEIEIATGVEVGKMAYGTGDVPFFRTSDMANWELKSDPKHRIAEDIVGRYAPRGVAEPEDVLVVRDGTYLVGTSAIVADDDCPMLFAAGIYRLRVLDHSRLDPYLLLVLLNTDVVQRQIRARQFTRDIIDTIGQRFYDVELPIPDDKEHCEYLASAAKKAIQQREALRRQLNAVLTRFSP